MRKAWKILTVASFLSLLLATSSFAGWKQDNYGWWYENADHSWAYEEWKKIEGNWYYFDTVGYMVKNRWQGNYYLGENGAMLTNSRTPDGYMVGSDGSWIPDQYDSNDVLNDVAIYGDLLFAPLHYEKQGDSWLVTGILCDSAYASKEYLSSLHIGDMISIPDETSGRVDFFKRVGRVSEVNQALGEVRIYDGTRGFGMVYTYTPNYINFTYADGIGEGPVYRVVKENVTLEVDSETTVQQSEFYADESVSDLLKRLSEWNSRGLNDVLELEIENGNHIKSMEDFGANYAG